MKKIIFAIVIIVILIGIVGCVNRKENPTIKIKTEKYNEVYKGNISIKEIDRTKLKKFRDSIENNTTSKPNLDKYKGLNSSEFLHVVTHRNDENYRYLNHKHNNSNSPRYYYVEDFELEMLIEDKIEEALK